jgi:iron complex outermembrane receptor protein
VTIKDQEATTERCSFTKRFSTNHDLSFTKSTENSNTRISLGASSTDGIENTGLDKYNATVYNANDFFGGALEERIIYATLKIEQLSCLMTPDLLEILLVPPVLESNIANLYRGNYNTVSNTFLNPVELLDSYKDFTNTNKFFGKYQYNLENH